MGMRPQGNEQEARRNKHVRSAPSKIAVKALGEEVLDGILDKSSNPLLLILDCVQDPHNLGAILRTADGAGVDAVIAPRDKSVGITETVLRVSVGAAEKVPFIQVTNLARTLRERAWSATRANTTPAMRAASTAQMLDAMAPWARLCAQARPQPRVAAAGTPTTRAASTARAPIRPDGW